MNPKRYRQSSTLSTIKRGSSNLSAVDKSAQVYVGHICSKISDSTVYELLSLCGRVLKWLRQPDPATGKMIHFGYCEFNSLEGVWRAMELLDGRKLGSKNLVVKCDTRVQKLVDDYINAYRPDMARQRMIQATLDALITSANQKWLDACLTADINKKPATVPSIPKPDMSFVSSRWRPSKREIRRAQRRAEEQKVVEQTYLKMIEDWEAREPPNTRNDDEDEWKFELIQKDAIDPISRRVDRELERKNDEIDRQREAEELEALERANAQELAKRESMRRELLSKREWEVDELKRLVAGDSSTSALRLEAFPFVLEIAKRVPKHDVFSIRLNWSALEAADVLNKRLLPWLRAEMFSRFGFEDEKAVSLVMKRLASRSDAELMLPVLERVFQQDAQLMAERIFKLLIFESLRLS